MKASSNDPLPGLRERQKAARYAHILASAGSLFNRLEFENVTMAAIAEHAEVSTPTVFNYFKTRDQLLLALVIQVHHETQQQVHAFAPTPSANLADAICEFLGMYTRTSLKSINRRTWRHVESTRIRLPESDFMEKYDALSQEMFDDFLAFLVHTIKLGNLTVSAQLKTVAEIIFNHWSVLFIDLVRDESLTIDDHVGRLRRDISALLGEMKNFS
ncbi:MAG: TetR/AcrR family transcriptional regulator [Gammaproteobacteria bacterium]|nr:TetR/AcrR family transcriptional regulator [Gammaproteobacteria bacterium]